jgi:hypothetical protein
VLVVDGFTLDAVELQKHVYCHVRDLLNLRT